MTTRRHLPSTVLLTSLLALLALSALALSRLHAPVSAQTTGQPSAGEAGAQLAVDLIHNCDAQADPGELQSIALFQRAVYTLWGQILSAESEEQGIARTQILAQVLCREEQTLGRSVPSDSLLMLHSTHVTIVAYLAGWSLAESASSRPYILQQLQQLLEQEVQAMAALRSAMP